MARNPEARKCLESLKVDETNALGGFKKKANTFKPKTPTP